MKAVNPSIFVLEKRRGGGDALTSGTDVAAFWGKAVAAAAAGGQASGSGGQVMRTQF